MAISQVNRRLYLVHWHNIEAEAMAHALRQMGWQVAVASNIAELDLKIVRQQPPRAAILSLSYHPQNGREIAETLWLTNWGRSIALIFLACPPEEELEFHRRFPAAIFTNWETLPIILDSLPDQNW